MKTLHAVVLTTILGAGCLQAASIESGIPALTLHGGDRFEWTVEGADGPFMWHNVTVGTTGTAIDRAGTVRQVLQLEASYVAFTPGFPDPWLRWTNFEFVDVQTGEMVQVAQRCLALDTCEFGDVSLHPTTSGSIFGITRLAGHETSDSRLLVSDPLTGWHREIEVAAADGRTMLRPVLESGFGPSRNVACNALDHVVVLGPEGLPISCDAGDGEWILKSRQQGDGPAITLRGTAGDGELRWMPVHSRSGLAPPGADAAGPPEFTLRDALDSVSTDSTWMGLAAQSGAWLENAFVTSETTACTVVCVHTVTWWLHAVAPGEPRVFANVTREWIAEQQVAGDNVSITTGAQVSIFDPLPDPMVDIEDAERALADLLGTKAEWDALTVHESAGLLGARYVFATGGECIDEACNSRRVWTSTVDATHGVLVDMTIEPIAASQFFDMRRGSIEGQPSVSS